MKAILKTIYHYNDGGFVFVMSGETTKFEVDAVIKHIRSLTSKKAHMTVEGNVEYIEVNGPLHRIDPAPVEVADT